jgi:hypothetical protein
VCGTGAGTGTEGSQPAQEGTGDFTLKATARLRTEAAGVNQLPTWVPNRSNRYRFSPGSAPRLRVSWRPSADGAPEQ